MCRLRGYDGAKRDGLNFPERRYHQLIGQLQMKSLEQIVADLIASGVQNPGSLDAAAK